MRLPACGFARSAPTIPLKLHPMNIEPIPTVSDLNRPLQKRRLSAPLAIPVALLMALSAWGNPAAAQSTCALSGGGNGGATAVGLNAFACGDNAHAVGAGSASVGIGAGAGSTGDQNSSNGTFAGQMVNGSNNTTDGTLSGSYVNGHYNTSQGAYSGAYVDGSYNTAVGTSSGRSVSGFSNIAIGSNAGKETSGNHNIAIGYEAGRGDTSGNDNIAIGRNTLSTVSGGVALGADSVSRASAGVAGYVPTGATAAQQAAISATTSTQGAVSVGDVEAGVYRQITGLAAGTEDSDAVNVSQLKAVGNQAQQDAAAGDARTLQQAQRYADVGDARTLRQANGYTDQTAEETRAYADAGDSRTLEAARQHTDASVGTLRKEMAEGIAQAAALIPMAPTGDGQSTLNVGMGSYRGQTALGLAYARQIGSLVVNGGLAIGSGKHHLIRMGAGWRF